MVATTTETVTQIDAVEEKVARMRFGWHASDDLALDPVGQDQPEIAEKLRQIELRALEMSGRLQELRQDVGLDAPDATNATKSKIIEQLTEKLASDDEG